MITTQTIPVDGALPHNFCSTCDAEVLVYRDLDDNGDFSYHCLDCNTALISPQKQLWSPEQVIEAGYAMEGILAGTDLSGGCENGGCSGGSCSTKHG